MIKNLRKINHKGWRDFPYIKIIDRNKNNIQINNLENYRFFLWNE